MLYIKKLVDIVAKHISSQPEIFTPLELKKDNKINHLYRLALEGKISTDEEAIRLLYGKSSKDASAFRMLKSRLAKKLENTIITFDAVQLEDYAGLSYQCYRNLFFARVLLFFNMLQSASTLLQATLKKAEFSQIFEVAYECLKQLRYLSALQGKKTDFERYNIRIKETQKILEAEEIANELFQRFILNSVKSIDMSPEVAEVAKQYTEQLKKLYKQFPTYRITTNYLSMETYLCNTTFQFERVLQVQDEREGFILKHPQFKSPGLMLNIYLSRVNACMDLKQYAKAEENIVKGLKYVEEGTYNYFSFNKVYLKLLAESGDYDRFNKLVSEILSHKGFQNQPDVIKQSFKINAAYGYYLKITGMASNDTGTRNFIDTKKSQNALLEEVPSHHSDKAGYNVALMIIQFLLLLELGKVDLLDDKMQAISRYRTRYLTKSSNARSYIFIKMLENMIVQGFSYHKTIAKTSGLLKNLEATHGALDTASNNSMEIIPYEKLWMIILERLKVKNLDLEFNKNSRTN